MIRNGVETVIVFHTVVEGVTAILAFTIASSQSQQWRVLGEVRMPDSSLEHGTMKTIGIALGRERLIS